MKYKAIGFDYGGVLTGITGTVMGQEIASLLGISLDSYRQAYFHHNRDVNLGLKDWPQTWAAVLEELGQPDKLNDLLRLVNDPDFGKLNEQILKLVEVLRSDGYKTGLLSNNTVQLAERIRHDGLEKYFDVLHVSAETGFVKPESGAFEHLVQALGVTMPELIFIDDSPKSLSTAAEVGYHPILYKNYGDLVVQLQNLGVLN